MSAVDVSSIQTGVTLDTGIFDQSYTGQATLEGVADFGEGNSYWVAQGAVNQYGYGPFNAMPRSVRFMMNGDKLCWYQASTAGAHDVRVRVNGVPISAEPIVPAGNGYQALYFKNAKERLIELRGVMGVGALLTQKRYEIWKPTPRRGPRILVIGNSWTSSANASKVMNSCWWDIGPLIGSDDVWVDYFGGTGITVGNDGAGTNANSFIHRAENIVLSGQTWDISAVNPKVIIVQGPENDIFKSKTNQQVIDGAVTLFQRLRQRCPKAKLVYIEGFAPPGFTPATYNPKFIAIRQALQAALASTGVYYIETANGTPWIRGAGTVSVPNADGLNSSMYIHADTYHPVDAGHLYVRSRMARRLRRVLADRGALLNQLV